MLMPQGGEERGSTLITAIIGLGVLMMVVISTTGNIVITQKFQKSADSNFMLDEVMDMSRTQLIADLANQLESGCLDMDASVFQESLLYNFYQGDVPDPKFDSVAKRCKNYSSDHTAGRYYFCNQLRNQLLDPSGNELTALPGPGITLVGGHVLAVETFIELVDLKDPNIAGISCSNFNSSSGDLVPGYRVHQSFHWYRQSDKAESKVLRKNVVYYADKT